MKTFEQWLRDKCKEKALGLWMIHSPHWSKQDSYVEAVARTAHRRDLEDMYREDEWKERVVVELYPTQIEEARRRILAEIKEDLSRLCDRQYGD